MPCGSDHLAEQKRAILIHCCLDIRLARDRRGKGCFTKPEHYSYFSTCFFYDVSVTSLKVCNFSSLVFAI